MSKYNGGHAFPTANYYDEKRFGAMPGMTLRDYFAAQALPSVIASYLDANGNECAADHALRNIPELAYKYADEMLKARQA